MREIITVHERICKHKTGAGSGCGWRHECLLARLRLGRLTFLTDEAFTNEALTGVEGEQGADRIAGRIFRRQSAPWLRVVKACFFYPLGVAKHNVVAAQADSRINRDAQQRD